VIELAGSGQHAFVHIPPRLDVTYLEGVLSRSLDRPTAITACKATNLCAWNEWGVSNSGATVLRLDLDLVDGTSTTVKAKILSPDTINPFKPDCRFDARLPEIAWARWWGKQGVSFAPIVYDTRADPAAREFWIVEEFFPQVGWSDFPADVPKGMGHFRANPDRLTTLFEHVAQLHSYSWHQRAALLERFSGTEIHPGYLCTPAMLVDALVRLLDDKSFLAKHRITTDECHLVASYVETVAQRPDWVDSWDVVCVTADWGPDNFGVRDPGQENELVIFDWGTTRLAPMEEDLDVLLTRLGDVEQDTRRHLVQRYLQVYGERTGRQIDQQTFVARLPWARFLVTLRYMAEHLNDLRWVGYQSRSEEMVHFFVGLCEGLHKYVMAGEEA